jgi:hypothetical protein
MSKVLNINVIEDNSITKKIKSTASALQKKYNKQRKVNEAKLMKNKNPFLHFISNFVNFLLILLTIFSILICLTTFLSRIRKITPTFAGYSFMQIVSESMTKDNIVINGTSYASGHNVGDKIVFRSVDTNTLNVGDKIAFYVYTPSLPEFYNADRILVDEVNSTKYEVSFTEFLGFSSKPIQQASKENSKLVFHHIVEIYETENGTRYFRTQGSSNNSPDYWTIKDCYVVGIYDNSTTGKIIGSILSFLTSKTGLILTIIIPLIFVGLLILLDACKNLGLAKLEWDCIEEKRKITDPICIKNNIGFNMSKKNKYKILVQAKPKDRLTYLSLLWSDGKAPTAIKKYVMRKDLLLRPNRKLLEVNRKCEKMFKQGKNPETIARFYLLEKAKIEQEQQNVKNRLKLISKYHKQNAHKNI